MTGNNLELNFTELECATGGVSGHSEVTIGIFGGSLTFGNDSINGKQNPYLTWTDGNGKSTTSRGSGGSGLT